ncbi:helix-turn-helix domain-containing protein [Caloramator sp. CAR-1]|uniref:helix-turn-helix transcriptional regulator n=1 Tax=Caloramator sp. CAR-1 TaxID=3062777 RepID=UPI0026E47D90|nr:helix-turn-helix domain-containing protein [Caloramator sp. CAR-1]MDO6353565.1 helix-turn-helix domain-containing protein [Caloramator sp. CAR-1]
MNKKLIAYRNMLRLTQADMAKLLNITQTSYSFKENGKVPFKQDEMIKITKFFKEKIPEITMDEIFFEEEVNKLKTLSTA